MNIKTKSGIDWLREENAPIWTATRLFHDDTICEMKQTFGVISIPALLHLWCFAARYYRSGKLPKKFERGFHQSIAQTCDSLEYDEYLELFDSGWFNWIIQHNLLEKTEKGYQVVFGLVHFDNPYNREEVQNR